LCQHLHTPSELATSCFANILRCDIHRISRQRLNCELFIRFADSRLPKNAAGAHGCWWCQSPPLHLFL
jgi:hypothetical protein